MVCVYYENVAFSSISFVSTYIYDRFRFKKKKKWSSVKTKYLCKSQLKYFENGR